MTGADTFTRLQGILCDLLMLVDAEVTPSTLLVQDLNLDSLGFVELEFSLEEAFGIKFPDVKLSPEIFALSLPESLAAIEAMPGGTTLFEFMKGEVIAAVLASGTRDDLAARFGGMLPAELGQGAAPARLSAAVHEQLLRVATIADLARAVDGRVPPGLDPTALLTSLHIAELFRFVTTSVMARYVDYLVAQRTTETRA